MSISTTSFFQRPRLRPRSPVPIDEDYDLDEKLHQRIRDDPSLPEYPAYAPSPAPVSSMSNVMPTLTGLSNLRNRYYADKQALREYYKANRPRKARLLIDSSGSVGYGRYRFGRRYRGRRPFYRRRYRRIRGRGGFWGDVWSGIKKGAGWAWQGAQPFLDAAVGGNPYGQAALGAARAFIGPGSLPGQGNYRFTGRNASLYGRGAYSGTVMDQDVPQVSNPGGTDGSVCIRHREYIGDVIVPANQGGAFFINFALPINPGAPQTFPWLSQIAQNFTQYTFQGLIFEYVSTSGELSTSQALGEVIQSANYNATDTAFVNKQQMLNEIFAVSKVCSQNAILGIETDPAQTSVNIQYTRGDTVPAGQDARFYDLGTYYLATQGIPGSAAVTLGELWVSYQCELYKPQLVSAAPLGPSEGAQAATYSASGYANATPLATVAHAQVAITDTIGMIITNTQIIFPSDVGGDWLVTVYWSGAASAAITLPGLSFGSAISALNVLGGAGGSIQTAPATGDTAFNASFSQAIRIQPGASTANSIITFGAGGTLPATPSLVQVFITRLN